MLAIRGRGIGALGKMSAVHCHDARFSVCCIHLEKKSTISPNSARLPLRNRSTLRAFRQRPVFPEYARSRLFSQKHSFPLKVEKKEINKNADAADINGGHRHSLIELFRDLHRDKSVSPRSTINAESKVSETKTPVKKSSSKAKSPQNKNVGKGTRKTINAEELDKNNETPIATENADAADVNGGHRHSLIELFRDIHRDKPVSPPNAESKVSETKTPAKKSSSKDKLSQKKNVGKTTRKSSNTKELDKSNEASSETPKTLEDTGKAVLSSNAKATKQRKPEASKVMEEASSARKTGGMASEDAMTRKTKLNPLYPPSGKSVMVVESATKAKTIQSYLGGMFEVLPSYGHVRDLAGRSGSVRPNDDFSMVWEVPSSAWTHLKTIKVALNGAENLILATDPDREGEAIAWHLAQMLEQQEALNKEITVARVVFHEITDVSIKKALQSPRDLDADLINAYLARRALDYLIGFSVSPLLWRKLPGCQSAGRVQSAALSLICDRELEVDHFKAEEYWTVVAQFCKTGLGLPSGNVSVISELTHLDTKRLNQLSICSQEDAESIKKKILSSNFTVKSSKKSKIHRNPPMPYITSTLQQDSANKLHFTASYTMKLAQKLYEGVNLSDGQATGLITYMRTDGLHVSEDAAKDIQSFVIERYGPDFASKAIRKYFKKVKNAQEAHEAIRPTSIRRLPSTLADFLEPDSLKLYTLIWIRTVACQMEAAAHDLVQVDISNDDGSIIFRASNSKIGFLGYQALYKEKEAGILRENDSGDSSEEAFEVLSALKINDDIEFKVVDLDQHFTKPPARYSEGSLVKKLEELGIGRPSTYAPILKVLQDRNYVTMKNRVLHPEFRGRMVSAFLSHYFAEVSDYSFTADLENELDNVSAGMTEWKGLLKDYWSRFKKYCDLANNVNIRQLEKMLENKFKHILFESLPHRICPSCSEGTLVLKISKYGTGFFIGCNEHPKCKYIVGSVFSEDEDEVTIDKPDLCFQPKLLGQSPTTNENIYLKKGPYGYYVQLGEDRKECSPKRASVSEVKDLDSITLEVALEFLRYPITLGNHPDDDYPVILCHSKAGFSIRHKRTIAPVPKRKDAKNLTLQAAVKLLSSKRAKHTGRPVRGEATTVAT